MGSCTPQPQPCPTPIPKAAPVLVQPAVTPLGDLSLPTVGPAIPDSTFASILSRNRNFFSSVQITDSAAVKGGMCIPSAPIFSAQFDGSKENLVSATYIPDAKGKPVWEIRQFTTLKTARGINVGDSLGSSPLAAGGDLNRTSGIRSYMVCHIPNADSASSIRETAQIISQAYNSEAPLWHRPTDQIGYLFMNGFSASAGGVWKLGVSTEFVNKILGKSLPEAKVSTFALAAAKAEGTVEGSIGLEVDTYNNPPLLKLRFIKTAQGEADGRIWSSAKKDGLKRWSDILELRYELLVPQGTLFSSPLEALSKPRRPHSVTVSYETLTSTGVRDFSGAETTHIDRQATVYRSLSPEKDLSEGFKLFFMRSSKPSGSGWESVPFWTLQNDIARNSQTNITQINLSVKGIGAGVRAQKSIVEERVVKRK